MKPKPYKLNKHTSRCSFVEGGGSACDGTTCVGIHYQVLKDGDIRYDSRTGGRYGTRVNTQQPNPSKEVV